MDFNKLEIGKRVLIEKSKYQPIAVGERGTIRGVSYDGYRVILDIDFDNGDRHVLDTIEFNFQVYDK